MVIFVMQSIARSSGELSSCKNHAQVRRLPSRPAPLLGSTAVVFEALGSFVHWMDQAVLEAREPAKNESGAVEMTRTERMQAKSHQMIRQCSRRAMVEHATFQIFDAGGAKAAPRGVEPAPPARGALAAASCGEAAKAAAGLTIVRRR